MQNSNFDVETMNYSYIIFNVYIFLDVNECLSSVCPENSHCENTLGSYICSCQPGFIKNATQCQGKTKVWKSERTSKEMIFYELYSYLGQSMQYP